MKKIIAAVCICLALGGCDYAKVDTAGDETKECLSMFVEIEATSMWYVVYHKETKVMYAVSGIGNREFTVLVNADGTPMLYDGSEKGGAE